MTTRPTDPYRVVSVRLPADLLAALDDLRQSTDCRCANGGDIPSRGHLIREAVTEYLESWGLLSAADASAYLNRLAEEPNRE